MRDFRKWGVKQRKFPENNYNAIWFNLKTLRVGEGQATELPPEYSEFYDVSLGNRCSTGKCNFCLVPGTLIKTSKGDIPIENIQQGDLVYSFNNDVELRAVDQTFKRYYEGDLIELNINGVVTRLTPNHKVYTENRGYVEAQHLQLDDTVLLF